MKKNMKFLALSIVVGGFGLSAGEIQAAVIIDDFADNSGTVYANGNTTTTLTNSDFSTSRYLEAINLSGSGGSVFVNNQLFGVNTNADSSVRIIAEYENSAGYDFTQQETGGGTTFDAFFLNLDSVDQGGIDIFLTITNSSGSSQTVSKTVTSIGEILFPHSDFGSSFDFSTVTKVQFKFETTNGTDAGFTNGFGSYGSEVPETSSAGALMMILALGLCQRRRSTR